MLCDWNDPEYRNLAITAICFLLLYTCGLFILFTLLIFRHGWALKKAVPLLKEAALVDGSRTETENSELLVESQLRNSETDTHSEISEADDVLTKSLLRQNNTSLEQDYGHDKAWSDFLWIDFTDRHFYFEIFLLSRRLALAFSQTFLGLEGWGAISIFLIILVWMFGVQFFSPFRDNLIQILDVVIGVALCLSFSASILKLPGWLSGVLLFTPFIFLLGEFLRHRKRMREEATRARLCFAKCCGEEETGSDKY
jgi:hypothetical protein